MLELQMVIDNKKKKLQLHNHIKSNS